MSKEIISIGNWNLKELQRILKDGSLIGDIGERINFLSSLLLGTPYGENTLIGSVDESEIFVINLEYLDCLTFLEYIEAMRLSDSFLDFKENLKKIRYKDRCVDYKKRNHFFTDWSGNNSHSVEDITLKIAENKALTLQKVLNVKKDMALYLQGITPRLRWISYIPSAEIDDSLIARLNTGDYIGIYSDEEGLDVSHVGIFIRDAKAIIFRHASSKKDTKKVVDEDFKEYISRTLGIMVIRPK